MLPRHKYQGAGKDNKFVKDVAMKAVKDILCGIVCLCVLVQAEALYVDHGDPYLDGPLSVGNLAVSHSADGSPKHVHVYFPDVPGDYAVLYFIGGFKGYIPVELHSVFISKLASHGFIVFGIDYAYPVTREDLDVYFQQLEFMQTFMVNKTVARPQWNNTSLLCHSAGCEYAYQMIEADRFPFKSVAFLEAVSPSIKQISSAKETIPALMYAVQYAFEGLVPCNIVGEGFKQFYNTWRCPRIEIQMADFGHCDILDPSAWEVCHFTHFCKTGEKKNIDTYKQTLSGIVASFFMTTIQGRPDAIVYISNATNIPLKTIVHESDWIC